MLVWKDLTVIVANDKRPKLASLVPSCCGSFLADFRPSGVEILQGVSGYANAGSLTAIMGPSGAGKTTLLECLAKRIEPAPAAGSVSLDGSVLTRDVMHKISSYLPQFDALPTYLTVDEYGLFVSALKIPGPSTTQTKKTIVEAKLNEFGIDRSGKTLISNLSGGERKRLALALELLTKPRILFADEPSSGLDQFSAERVLRALKNIATVGEGKTIVICTIHQPGIDMYRLFDRVLWMDLGRVTYFGSPKERPIVLSRDDPGNSEVMTEVIEPLPDTWTIIKNDEPQNARWPPRALPVQLLWLLWRAWLRARRQLATDWNGWISYFLSILAVGVFYGKIDSRSQEGIQNARGAIYMSSSEIVFTVAYSVLYELPSDYPVYACEKSLYTPVAYYLATVLALTPQTICKAVLFTGILHYLLLGPTPISIESGSVGESMILFLYYCLSTIPAAIAGAAYGMAFSGWVRDVEIATTMMVPVDILFLMTAGIFYNVSTVRGYLAYLKYGSIFFYANEALSILHWQRVTEIACLSDRELPCIRSGQQVLTEYGFDQGNFWWDILAMLLLAILMHLIGYLGVKRRNSKAITNMHCREE